MESPKRELCGFLGKTGKPCMRTASCPFHTHIKVLSSLMGSSSAERPPAMGSSSDEETRETKADIKEEDENVKQEGAEENEPPADNQETKEEKEDESGAKEEDQEADGKDEPVKKKKKRKPVSHVSRRRKKKSSSKRREWTRAEHIVFLRGLKKFGKGSDAWKKIEGELETRNVRQIQSHAQKYFLYLSQGTRNEDSLFHIKLKGLSEADQKEVDHTLAEIKKQLKIEGRRSSSSGDEDATKEVAVKKQKKKKEKKMRKAKTESSEDDVKEESRVKPDIHIGRVEEDDEEAEDGDYMEGKGSRKKRRTNKDENSYRGRPLSASADSLQLGVQAGDDEGDDACSIAERAKRRSRRKVVNYEEIDEEMYWQKDEEDFRNEKGEIELIKDVRRKKGHVQYLVKWKDYDDEEDDTWEPERRLLIEKPALLQAFKDSLKQKKTNGEKSKRKRSDDEEQQEEKKKNKKAKKDKQEKKHKKDKKMNGDGKKYKSKNGDGESTTMEAALSLTFLANMNVFSSRLPSLINEAEAEGKIMREAEGQEDDNGLMATLMETAVSQQEQQANGVEDERDAMEDEERAEGGRNLSSLLGFIHQDARSFEATTLGL